MRKIFGFPLYFLIIVVLLKAAYLLAESAYNTIVLDSGTVKEFTEKIFNNLELLGHNVTSLGVTLLLMPLCYWLISKVILKREWVKFSLTMVSSAIIFFFVFHSLNYLMDYIVEKNKEQRYSAYYLNILKNGISNNVLGHSSILKFDKDNEQSFSVDEKVIINNIFLLSFIDKNNVIEKISTMGMDSFLKFYGQKKYKEEFSQQNMKFMEFANNIKKLYSQYEKIQGKANKTYNDNRKLSRKQYLEFKKNSLSNYNEYKQRLKGMKKNIKKDVKDLQNDKEFQNNWNKFVKNYNRGGTYKKHALSKYNSYMLNKLGRRVKPSKWCAAPGGVLSPFVEIADSIIGKFVRNFIGGRSDYSGCLNTYAVTEIISKNYYNKWNQKTNVPYSGINTLDEYLLNPSVKKEVIKNLRNKGIQVKNSFKYKEKEFRDAYVQSITKTTFSEVNKMYAKLGLTGIENNLDFKSFTLSPQILNLSSQKLQGYSKKSQKRILDLIALQKTENFYNEIYAPGLEEALNEEFVLSKEQLATTHKEKGNKAIKALYIPPIAIALSLIFGVMNAISLVSLLIALIFVLLFKVEQPKVKLIKQGIVSIFATLSVVLPFLLGGENYFNNAKDTLQNSTSNTVSVYSDVLTWILIFEKYNYPTGVDIRNLLSKEQLKEYGLTK